MMLINWGRVAAALTLLAALSAGVWKIYHVGVVSGRADVQAQWDQARVAQAESDLKLETDTRARELALQADADTLRRTKDAQLNKLRLAHATALDGLRSRPERPPQSDVPSSAVSGDGCYPSQLYREDASVVVEFAAEADQLRINLGRCQDAYESVRNGLNELRE